MKYDFLSINEVFSQWSHMWKEISLIEMSGFQMLFNKRLAGYISAALHQETTSGPKTPRWLNKRIPSQ